MQDGLEYPTEAPRNGINRDREATKFVVVDTDLPDDITYTVVADDAMMPVSRTGVGGYVPGDKIGFSQSTKPRDGAVVIAALEGHDTPILREYRERGSAIDLIATNEEYPLVSITKRTPGRIIAVVIEHRRRVF